MVRHLLMLLAILAGRTVLAQAHEPLARTASPHGAGFTEPCVSCHTGSGWKPVRVSRAFKHAERTFPLSGAHGSATCASCHKTLDFKVPAASCASCHEDIHKGEFGADCARCHTSRSFVDRSSMTRMHQLTRFPLRAAHAVVSCESCHLPTRPGQAQFARARTECASCHLGTFRTTSAPPHVEPSFSRDCTSCHKSSSWSGASFDHAKTLFPLTGGHRAATCASCHADKQYRGRSLECQSCHQQDFAATKDPPHAQGFPTNCLSCHTTEQWKGARFDHAVSTRFALTGAHRAATCAQCHGTATFRGTAQECASCHQGAYDATTTPKHAAARFPVTCASCHTTTQWNGAGFDHSTTQFPLTGAHRTATCANCHADQVYDGKPTTCVTCHQAKYDGTTNPGHRASGFSTTCQTCHTTATWAGASFDHGATRFPLTGAHRATTCSQCHADGVFAGKPTTCVSCHQVDYNGTTSPNHASSGFPVACEGCHTTAQWAGAVFDHAKTLFPLTGAHGAATCADCHGDGVYRGKPTTCVTCHNSDWSASTNPHHAAAGFVQQCETCHTTVQWTGAPYNHNATSFPLTGAHLTQACAACHASRVYKGLPATCVSCHQAAYTSTTNPNHAAAGLPTSCQSCHTTTQWAGATFNHDASWFPIYSGAHRGKWQRCTECHTSSASFAAFTCLSCHPHSDRTKTDGNHQGRSGYSYDSQRCYACHPRGT